MTKKRFKVVARVSTANPDAIKPILRELIAKGSVNKKGDEFLIEADMEGADAKELNRPLLSALRKVVKKTRLRAEWMSDEGTTQRFFDYVLKKKSVGATR